MKIIKVLAVLVVSIALVACGESGDDDNGGAAGGDGEATVSFDGEELPVNRVRCSEGIEGGWQVQVTFDLEPAHYTDVYIWEHSVDLRLPTELGSEAGFDLWRSSDMSDFEVSGQGAVGTTEMEGHDLHGVGTREPGMLEVESTCPS